MDSALPDVIYNKYFHFKPFLIMVEKLQQYIDDLTDQIDQYRKFADSKLLKSKYSKCVRERYIFAANKLEKNRDKLIEILSEKE